MDKIFYHGSNRILKQSDLKNEVMYFTDDLSEAKGYSLYKYNSKRPIILYAHLDMKNSLKDEKILYRVMEKLNIDRKDLSLAEIFEDKKIVEKLSEMGYDSAIMPDFGFNHDFKEFNAYIVFNAKDQVKIIYKIKGK